MIAELWSNLTVGQAVVIAVAAWLAARIFDEARHLIRRLRGLPPHTDHREHCAVEQLEQRLDELADWTIDNLGSLQDYARDQLDELERIRVATEATADRDPVDIR